MIERPGHSELVDTAWRADLRDLSIAAMPYLRAVAGMAAIWCLMTGGFSRITWYAEWLGAMVIPGRNGTAQVLGFLACIAAYVCILLRIKPPEPNDDPQA